VKVSSKGMVLWGVMGSEAVDSSGEILSVKGADISQLPVTGTIIYEHKKPVTADKKPVPGVNGEEVVGRILSAKKVYGPGDCENQLETDAWNRIKLPFICGTVRLADAAGNTGAQALASMIRDNHAHGEPILCRWSVDGLTLEKKGTTIARSVCRKVAITYAPCNRTCDTALLLDPRAPAGFELESTHGDRPVPVLKGEHQVEGRLGGSDIAAIVFDPLEKATTAGSYDAAPSTLTGGAALQREDRGLHRRLAKLIKDQESDKFEKSAFRELLRAEMPEISDDAAAQFAQVAEGYHAKLRQPTELRKDEGKPTPTPLSPAEDGVAEPQPVKIAHVTAPKEERPKRWGDVPVPNLGERKKLAMDERGNLVLPSGKRLEFHVPKGDEYMSVLHPDAYDLDPHKKAFYQRTVHEPFERAMASWMELNNAARDRKLPKSVVRLAALFAGCSPNTAVPLQERHYGHAIDMIQQGSMPLMGPITDEHIDEFTTRATGPDYPQWNHEHYVEAGPPPGVATVEEQRKSRAEPNAWGNPKADLPQVVSMRHLDEIVPYLEHVVAEHGDDARSAAARLMGMKVAQTKYKAAAVKAKKGKKDLDERYQNPEGSKLPGFGPKLTRYALTMMGMGNCLDAETEALTTRGWVKGFDLKMGDVLLTKNPRTMELEWQPMTDLRLFPDYEGPLVELKSRSFHAITTPNHRWLVTTKKNSEGYGETVREKTSDTLTVGVDRIHRTGHYDPPVRSGLTGDEAELLGWFVTDGFYQRKRSRGGWRKGEARGLRRPVGELYITGSSICQSVKGNPEKCERIDYLLKRLDRFGEVKATKRRGRDEMVWRLGKRLTSLLQEWAPARALTVASLLKLDLPSLLRLREAMVLGDGTRSQHRPHWTGYQTLATGRKDQADAFQVLLTLTGSSSVSEWRKSKATKAYPSMKNKIPQSKGAFLVRSHARGFTALDGEHHRRRFSGKVAVWCPAVPNTFFVARRDGQVWITGNTIVPDRHMIRSLYGVRRFDPVGNYLASETFTNAAHEPLLTALDRHFFLRHPAVSSVLGQYPEHFKGREEQAIFPAFWKHWLILPHYEENSHPGDVGDYAKNVGTDHKVFWDSVQDAMRRHGIPVRGAAYSYHPEEDASFDFGANVEKSEVDARLPLEDRAYQALQCVREGHGETGMLAAYFLHVLPALMDAEKGRRRRDPNWVIRKAEALTAEVLAAAQELRKSRPDEEAPPTFFAGNPVRRGLAETADGKYDLLYEDDHHYVAVPEGVDERRFAFDLTKMPKALEGSHFRVVRRPSVAVADL
jgi:hypothetical protein